MAQLIDTRTTRTEAPLLCWRNALSDGTATASDTATDFSPSAALTYATYEGWQPNDDDAYLDLALASDRTVN